jgi:signal transduction protein with GAF and PtsI domain
MARTRTENKELALLSEATHLLGNAPKPERALQPLVALVKARISSDVCSLYLLDAAGTELVLAATDGLAQSAIGQVRMHPSEGLTGLVAELRAPVSVPEAARHPRYRYFPETGEERYHSFLGVPLLRHGAVAGVLVVQTRVAREFSRDEVRMLSAVAAQLAGLLRSEKALSPVPARELERKFMFPAIGASVLTAEDVDTAVAARAQALYAPASVGEEMLAQIAAGAPGTLLVLGCEARALGSLGHRLHKVAWRSPLRFAAAGAFEPDELRAARDALVDSAGSGADVTVGSMVDAAAGAMSIKSLASAGDFFVFDTTELVRSATGGRSADPFVPAVLRMLARALHAAREVGRPTFVVGELVSVPEGWLAAAGFGADVLIVPASAIGAVRRFAMKMGPGGVAHAARAALRAHASADARRTLATHVNGETSKPVAEPAQEQE